MYIGDTLKSGANVDNYVDRMLISGVWEIRMGTDKVRIGTEETEEKREGGMREIRISPSKLSLLRVTRKDLRGPVVAEGKDHLLRIEVMVFA